MKHAGAQLFHEQRKLQHSQHGVLVCARNQGEEAWGQLGMIPKWEKPFYKSGMKMMKFRKEEYQMLLLSIDRKTAREMNYNPFLLKIRGEK